MNSVSRGAERLLNRLGFSPQHLLGLRFAINVFIAAGISGSSRLVGVERGLHKVMEVLFGCIVGIAVSWLMSKVWLVRPKA